MKLYIKISLVVFLFLGIGLIVFSWLEQRLIPGEVDKRIQAWVTESCESCRLYIDEVNVTLFPVTISLGHVRFVGGDRAATEVSFEVQSIIVPIFVWDLLSGTLHLGKIKVIRPEVAVIEGNQRSGDSEGLGNGSGLSFVSEGITLSEGKFSYFREDRGKSGVIRVTDIEAQVQEFGSTSKLLHAWTKAQVHAILEDSGEIYLSVSTPLFSDPEQIEIELQLDGQNLKEMNRYFEPSDGLKLTGSLISGLAKVSIEGNQMNGSVDARYKGLDIQFNRTDTRSELTAFFQNLVKSFKMASNNTDRTKQDQVQSIKIKRRSEETLLKFIFRGLKDAALKVTTT